MAISKETLTAIETALDGVTEALSKVANEDWNDVVDIQAAVNDAIETVTQLSDKHPDTDEHRAGCPECQMAHDKSLPDSPEFDAFSVDAIMKWESGEMNENEEIQFFQQIINTGLAWKLQGMYGRRAMELILAGLCQKK